MFIVCIILNKVANAFSNKHTNIPVLSVLDSRIPRFPDSPIPEFPDSRIPRFPNSPISGFPDSPIPCFKDSPADSLVNSHASMLNFPLLIIYHINSQRWGFSLAQTASKSMRISFVANSVKHMAQPTLIDIYN